MPRIELGLLLKLPHMITTRPTQFFDYILKNQIYKAMKPIIDQEINFFVR